MAYYGDNAIHAWGCADDDGVLRTGHNISGVNDNGSGDMTASFTNNAANSNYATNLTTQTQSNNAESVTAIHTSSTSSVRMRTGYTYYGGMAWYNFGDFAFQYACYSLY